MEQVIVGGYNDGLGAIATEYNAVQGGNTWQAQELRRWEIVTTPGKIKNLRVELRDGAPGAGKSYTFHLRVNGANSTLTCIIADDATSNEDTTHEVVVAAGDYISLQSTPAGAPTVRYPRWTMMFEGNNVNESLLLGGGPLYKGGTQCGLIMGSETPIDQYLAHYVNQICPTAGKIKNLYVKLSEDPGATGSDGYRFTLRKNGISQTLTVTITADDTTGNDTAHEITVAAGDELYLLIEPLNAPAISPWAGWGMTFEADIDGESLILGTSGNNTHITNTEYEVLCQGIPTAWYSSDWLQQIAQECTFKKLYIELQTAPGDGKSFTFTSRIANGDGNLTVTITGAATKAGNDTTHTDAISDGDEVGLKCVPADSPTVSMVWWGLVCYIEPLGWQGIISGVTNPAKIMGVDVANINKVKGVVSA